MNRSEAQRAVVESPISSRIFLEGPAGTGKTTTAVARLQALLDAGVPGAHIVILTPQRALAAPYYEFLRSPLAAPGGQVSVLTAGGLARRMVDLFWPMVAREAGFSNPNLPPAFLTLETAQYYMAHLVRPMLDDNDLFKSISVDRNRLYSQILDNLNKAALNNFPFSQIGERLSAAWSGESSQLRVYADVQQCASLFRSYCLEHNLLDFSLQVEIFRDLLRPSLLGREYLRAAVRHVIADNIEEDTPFAHDLLEEWLPGLDSALLIYDDGAGYRSFLGADPEGAAKLSAFCETNLRFDHSFTAPAVMHQLAQDIGFALERPETPAPAAESGLDALVLPSEELRFFPQMLDWVARQTADLIAAGTPPGEIAILAPFMPDSLRFSLTARLDALNIPYRSHRPSRSLSDEPAARCLITLARLAHPEWKLRPGKVEVVHALFQCVEGLDLVRAQLLVEILFPGKHKALQPFSGLNAEMQERITDSAGERYEFLRRWIEDYATQPMDELDLFFSRLFGEVLSQKGYKFHNDLDAGQITANLIESAAKFRRAIDSAGGLDGVSIGCEFIQMVMDGVIAAAYVENWQPPANDAVFLAPAFTFLLNNRAVDVQFWLDAGSNGWFERLYQPLTHPYVLSRSWTPGRLWTAADEFEANRDVLYRLAAGLLRRARSRIYLAFSRLGESGSEQTGMLLRSIHRVQVEALNHD